MLHNLKKHAIISSIIAVVGTVSCTLIVLIILPTTRHDTRIFLSSLQAHLTLPASTPFPTIDTTDLNETQKRIIKITHTEYNKRPISFDSTVLKYTDGNKESWCADYTSWVLKEADQPLVNPTSGYWRIPGVLTLQQYFIQTGRYKKAGTYTPKTGDLAIYIGDKTLDGRSRQHTNIVLKVEGVTMTTIGGNERGRMRISTQDYRTHQNSLVGFGTL